MKYNSGITLSKLKKTFKKVWMSWPYEQSPDITKDDVEEGCDIQFDFYLDNV